MGLPSFVLGYKNPFDFVKTSSVSTYLDMWSVVYLCYHDLIITGMPIAASLSTMRCLSPGCRGKPFVHHQGLKRAFFLKSEPAMFPSASKLSFSAVCQARGHYRARSSSKRYDSRETIHVVVETRSLFAL